MSEEYKYKRVLLKLSGEALAGDMGYGIDPKVVDNLADEIAEIVKDGGNFWRGRSSGKMDRMDADKIGMLATVMNALALQDAFERHGMVSRVQSAISMKEVAEPYIRRRCISQLEKGYVVVLAAGTGNPYFTTDTTAALRGMELQCDAIIKATKVDGIYDKDPAKFADATKFDTITYDETLNRHIGVMDATAFALVRDNNLPIIVCRMLGGDIIRAVKGEKIGTIVTK